jgi:hypothetical protein
MRQPSPSLTLRCLHHAPLKTNAIQASSKTQGHSLLTPCENQNTPPKKDRPVHAYSEARKLNVKGKKKILYNAAAPGHNHLPVSQ